MSLFKPRQPRPFHHEWLYVNERHDRLKAIEEKARRELGMTTGGQDSQPPSWNHLHGAFSPAPRSGRQKGGLSLRSNALAAFLLVISIAILFILIF